MVFHVIIMLSRTERCSKVEQVDSSIVYTRIVLDEQLQEIYHATTSRKTPAPKVLSNITAVTNATRPR